MKPSATYPGWLLRSMLSIPSVSGKEDRVARFLAEQMDSLGMESYVDEIGNVHGITGPDDAPTVMLLGHIDTVPGNVPVCRVGDLLYGRGAVDAKGPMAAMTCAAARTSGVRVHVVGAVGEEAPESRGAQHVLATVDPPDAVVIGEPSGWDGVCLGYKGRVGVGFEVSKPTLHTSSPVPTAVESAMEFSRAVEDYLSAVSRSDNPISFEAATGTLIHITGDLGHAEAFITCRVPPGFDFDAFALHLRRHSEGKVWFDDTVPAVRRSRGDLVASQLRAAIQANGGRPKLKVKAGTADMNLLDVWDTPMAAYGPGDAHLDHTCDEHIAMSEFTRSIDVLETALTRVGTSLRKSAEAAPVGGSRRAESTTLGTVACDAS